MNKNNNSNENRGVTRNASCYIIIDVFTIQWLFFAVAGCVQATDCREFCVL